MISESMHTLAVSYVASKYTSVIESASDAIIDLTPDGIL